MIRTKDITEFCPYLGREQTIEVELVYTASSTTKTKWKPISFTCDQGTQCPYEECVLLKNPGVLLL